MLLTCAEFAYNKAPSKTIGMSPFTVSYRVDSTSPLNLMPKATNEKLSLEASKRVKEIPKLHKQVINRIKKSKCLL